MVADRFDTDGPRRVRAEAEVGSLLSMPVDDDGSNPGWRSYFGPVILTDRRRRFNATLLAVWVAAAVAALATGNGDLVWLPLIGIVTSSVLFFRDRAGRRRAQGRSPHTE
jgi:hypothetical protein